MIIVLYISTFNSDFLNQSTSTFVGLGNYTHLFFSANLWHSLWVALYFIVGSAWRVWRADRCLASVSE